MTDRKSQPKRLPMVCWFDPRQLVVTGVDVFVSTIFGRHADHRLVEAMAVQDADHNPVSYRDDADKKTGEFWIDYAADVGDGWDSTYAVAWWLSRAKLELADPSGKTHPTHRGRVLIFGGDEVYPAASRIGYEERLLLPYRTALPDAEPRPDVFAIPGNHDWYDSLVSFSRFFMRRKSFGAWQTRQKRSYFALELPHGWWLLGIDVQLGSDIDVLQLQYFKDIAKRIEPEHRVILCTADPEWIWEAMYGKFDEKLYSERTLQDFEKAVLGRRADVIIAGDLHHYRRHEQGSDSGRKRQKITAGGGGAFLHPTHGPDVRKLGKTSGQFHLVEESVYPDENTSRRLCWRNLLFPLHNPSFLWLAGLVYLLTAWAIKMEIPKAGRWQWSEALEQTCEQLLRSPSAAFWVMSLLGMFVLFTDTHSRLYRWLGGIAHGLGHLGAIFVIAWSAIFVADTFNPPRSGLAGFIGWYLLPGLSIFAIGAVAGSVLLGIYLLISLNVFRRHSNESFSALAIPDWKNFLRLRIDRDGLTIFPIGIDRVPRRWKEDGAQVLPDDPDATEPRLIEPPVRV